MATAAAPIDSPAARARAIGARVWSYRFVSELEIAQRFDKLAEELCAVGASAPVIAMASRAAEDERRHAALCSDLVRHFGGRIPAEPRASVTEVSPAWLDLPGRVLCEVVAVACVTETLSTALLGELIARARDSLARRVMHSILGDEVAHSRLGWAFLAEGHDRDARDAVSDHLPDMLRAALGDDPKRNDHGSSSVTEELAGLGALPWRDKDRIVSQTLQLVVFPGLERFGVDTKPGRRWFEERDSSRRWRETLR